MGIYKKYSEFTYKRELPMSIEEKSYLAAKFWCLEDAKNFVQAEL